MFVMRSLFILLCSSFFFFSCKEEIDGPNRPPELKLSVYLLDKDGNDLLNSETVGAYNADEVRIYYVINGEEVLKANPDGVELGFAEAGVSEEYPDSIYFLNLEIIDPTAIVDNRITSILKWNNTEADTIVCVTNPDYFDEILKVYVNGEFKWDEYTPSPIYKDYGNAEICLVK